MYKSPPENNRIRFEASLFLCMCLSPFLMACAQENPSKNNGTETSYRVGKASRDGIGKWYFGREIAKTMDFAGAPWLERTDRNEEENTELAIEKLPLRPSSVVADLGAGTGYYAFRMAKKVTQGKVFAIDIQDRFVEFLEERRKELKISNLFPTKGTDSSIEMEKGSLDMVLMVDVYHELEFPQEMLRSIHRSLKSDGKLVLIEFRGEDPSIPIKQLHKMTVAQVKKELKENGFKLSYNGDFLPIQHFLIFEKSVQ